MSKPLESRTAAALALQDVLVKRVSLTHATELYGKRLQTSDIPLFKAITFGVMRHYYRLAAQIDPLLDKPLRNKDKDIYALLLMGVYQRQYMRTPDYAAIDSCVKASKALKKTWGAGLINAVLRQIGDDSAIKNNLLVDSDHPLWLFQAIRKAWGEQAQTIFSANNTEPPLCIRVNASKISRDQYIQQLLANGISCSKGEHSPTAVYLHDKPKNIVDLPGFKEGECSVQDEAPQLSAFLLPLEKGLRVLDACAAPGGKTCHLLETEPRLAHLLAVDIEPGRLARVQENLQRLQLKADCLAADIAQPSQWWDGQPFDRILCDVPCSATGVIRRHPDIKYLRRADDIAALSELQFTIVDALWPTLKPGGFLLYATCSILPQENEQVMARFLASHADAKEHTLALDCGIAASHGRQLFPQTHGHDGFYYALLQKTAE